MANLPPVNPTLTIELQNYLFQGANKYSVRTNATRDSDLVPFGQLNAILAQGVQSDDSEFRARALSAPNVNMQAWDSDIEQAVVKAGTYGIGQSSGDVTGSFRVASSTITGLSEIDWNDAVSGTNLMNASATWQIGVTRIQITYTGGGSYVGLWQGIIPGGFNLQFPAQLPGIGDVTVSVYQPAAETYIQHVRVTPYFDQIANRDALDSEITRVAGTRAIDSDLIRRLADSEIRNRILAGNNVALSYDALGRTIITASGGGSADSDYVRLIVDAEIDRVVGGPQGGYSMRFDHNEYTVKLPAPTVSTSLTASFPVGATNINVLSASVDLRTAWPYNTQIFWLDGTGAQHTARVRAVTQVAAGNYNIALEAVTTASANTGTIVYSSNNVDTATKTVVFRGYGNDGAAQTVNLSIAPPAGGWTASFDSDMLVFANGMQTALNSSTLASPGYSFNVYYNGGLLYLTTTAPDAVIDSEFDSHANWSFNFAPGSGTGANDFVIYKEGSTITNFDPITSDPQTFSEPGFNFADRISEGIEDVADGQIQHRVGTWGHSQNSHGYITSYDFVTYGLGATDQAWTAGTFAATATIDSDGQGHTTLILRPASGNTYSPVPLIGNFVQLTSNNAGLSTAWQGWHQVVQGTDNTQLRLQLNYRAVSTANNFSYASFRAYSGSFNGRGAPLTVYFSGIDNDGGVRANISYTLGTPFSGWGSDLAFPRQGLAPTDSDNIDAVTAFCNQLFPRLANALTADTQAWGGSVFTTQYILDAHGNQRATYINTNPPRQQPSFVGNPNNWAITLNTLSTAPYMTTAAGAHVSIANASTYQNATELIPDFEFIEGVQDAVDDRIGVAFDNRIGQFEGSNTIIPAAGWTDNNGDAFTGYTSNIVWNTTNQISGAFSIQGTNGTRTFNVQLPGINGTSTLINGITVTFNEFTTAFLARVGSPWPLVDNNIPSWLGFLSIDWSRFEAAHPTYGPLSQIVLHNIILSKVNAAMGSNSAGWSVVSQYLNQWSDWITGSAMQYVSAHPILNTTGWTASVTEVTPNPFPNIPTNIIQIRYSVSSYTRNTPVIWRASYNKGAVTLTMTGANSRANVGPQILDQTVGFAIPTAVYNYAWHMQGATLVSRSATTPYTFTITGTVQDDASHDYLFHHADAGGDSDVFTVTRVEPALTGDTFFTDPLTGTAGKWVFSDTVADAVSNLVSADVPPIFATLFPSTLTAQAPNYGFANAYYFGNQTWLLFYGTNTPNFDQAIPFVGLTEAWHNGNVGITPPTGLTVNTGQFTNNTGKRQYYQISTSMEIVGTISGGHSLNQSTAIRLDIYRSGGPSIEVFGSYAGSPSGIPTTNSGSGSQWLVPLTASGICSLGPGEYLYARIRIQALQNWSDQWNVYVRNPVFQVTNITGLQKLS